MSSKHIDYTDGFVTILNELLEEDKVFGLKGTNQDWKRLAQIGEMIQSEEVLLQSEAVDVIIFLKIVILSGSILVQQHPLGQNTLYE